MGLVSAARSVIGLIITLVTTIWVVYIAFLLAILHSIARITNNIIHRVAKTLLTVKQSIVRTTKRIFSFHPVRVVRNVIHRIFKIVQQNITRPIFAFLRIIGHRILKIIGKIFEPIFAIIWKIVEPIFEVVQTTAEPILEFVREMVISMMNIIQNIINRLSRVKVVQNIGNNLLKIEAVRKWYDRYHNPRIPPGPLGLPIVGHLLQMGDNMGEALLEWKEVYGPMISVRFGSFNTVVFNDCDTVIECFQRQTCSGRAEVAYFKDAVKRRGIRFGEQQDDIHVELRDFMMSKMIEFGLGADHFEAFMTTEISFLLNSLALKDGESISIHHLFSATAINPFWNCLTKKRFGVEDPALKRLADICEGILGLPTGLEKLAHFIPWLGRLLPCPTGYKTGRRRFGELVQFMEEQIAGVDESRVWPDQRNVADAFKDKVRETLDENSCFFQTKNNRPYSFCDVFIGAIDTTSALLEWAVLYLAVHTDVQRMLQRQISEQLQNGRVPKLTDRKEIPYAEAVLYEVIRKVPLVTMNFGREALADVKIGDYTIPKGTMLLANFYGLCMDKDVWGDPENFRPERFIGGDGMIDIRDLLPFSAGSRGCIGGETVKDQFFLVITSLFQKFNVTCIPGKVTLEKKSYGYIVHPDHSNEVVFKARGETTPATSPTPEGRGFDVDG